MKAINSRKLALATGLVSVVIYLCCYLIMTLVGKNGIVKLSNLLFHGMDFSNIIRMDIPITESLFGIFVSFIIWGLVGYLVATIYNKIK